MRFSEQLLHHAIWLMQQMDRAPDPVTGHPRTVDMRRAVSAAYYALFHRLSEAAVEQIAPHASPEAANRIHRWLEHAEMKKICGEFAGPKLNPPLSDLLGNSVSEDMRTVAGTFLRLQDARHAADYDLDYDIRPSETESLIRSAVDAISTWQRIAQTAEANIFVLSLLLWKKWESSRK